MWDKDVTWGTLRAFHEQMRTSGAESPDDMLSDPKMYELSLSKEDHEYVYEISEQEAARWKALREENNIDAKPGTVSVTISDEGEVLELIKVLEDDETTWVREDGQWCKVYPEEDEEDNRIFDQTLQDVAPRLTEYWDRLRKAGAPITKEVIQDYAI